jgi:hypothetical protein
MKTILRIIIILLVAAIVAATFFVVVNNSTITSSSEIGQSLAMTSADAQIMPFMGLPESDQYYI